jgi:hypothetical protein
MVHAREAMDMPRNDPTKAVLISRLIEAQRDMAELRREVATVCPMCRAWRGLRRAVAAWKAKPARAITTEAGA